MRAREVFFALLTDAQRKEIKRKAGITVKGSLGGTYFIYADGVSYSGNVYEMVGNRRVRGYCAYPRGVPKWDIYTAQKLMLETDEGAFRSIAAGMYVY